MSKEKTTRPPNRSVSIPTGMRARDPSRTGTATSSAVWVADSSNNWRNCGAKALIKPHAAKHRAKEALAIARDCAAERRIQVRSPDRSQRELTKFSLLGNKHPENIEAPRPSGRAQPSGCGAASSLYLPDPFPTPGFSLSRTPGESSCLPTCLRGRFSFRFDQAESILSTQGFACLSRASSLGHLDGGSQSYNLGASAACASREYSNSELSSAQARWPEGLRMIEEKTLTAKRVGTLGQSFYFFMSLLIAGVVVYGFSHSVNQRLIHPSSPRPLILYFHAPIFAGWV